MDRKIDLWMDGERCLFWFLRWRGGWMNNGIEGRYARIGNAGRWEEVVGGMGEVVVGGMGEHGSNNKGDCLVIIFWMAYWNDGVYGDWWWMADGGMFVNGHITASCCCCCCCCCCSCCCCCCCGNYWIYMWRLFWIGFHTVRSPTVESKLTEAPTQLACIISSGISYPGM